MKVVCSRLSGLFRTARWRQALLVLALVLGAIPGAHAQNRTIRFAVISDCEGAKPATTDVANLVKSWNPEFIVTAGDNYDASGAAGTIDQNIGQFYHQFIYPYVGSYGPGSSDGINRFFPALGNHDW